MSEIKRPALEYTPATYRIHLGGTHLFLDEATGGLLDWAVKNDPRFRGDAIQAVIHYLHLGLKAAQAESLKKRELPEPEKLKKRELPEPEKLKVPEGMREDRPGVYADLECPSIFLRKPNGMRLCPGGEPDCDGTRQREGDSDGKCHHRPPPGVQEVMTLHDHFARQNLQKLPPESPRISEELVGMAIHTQEDVEIAIQAASNEWLYGLGTWDDIEKAFWKALNKAP